MNKKCFSTLLLVLCYFATQAQHQPANKGLTPELMRSPENQVFQFMQSGVCNAWADSSKTNSTLYLWIPETCQQLKGLLIMCTNVPEQMLVGHQTIRKICAANQLGIIWGTPTFMNFRKSTNKALKQPNMALEYKTSTDFLQQMLDGLAQTSGYPEVATVPWLPMGESGHLLMVDALMEQHPERCMAGIFIKNNHLPPHNREVPTLTIFGTSQEWGQDKVDMRKRWNDVEGAYNSILTQRRANRNWPLSYVIDGTSGHFDCSEMLVNYMAKYIDAMAKARIATKGTEVTLKPLTMSNGFLADLPVLGHENKPIKPFNLSDTATLPAPWFINKSLAEEAQKIARINWKAATQLPAFITDSGQTARFDFNGIPKFTPIITDDDGITFKVKGFMLDSMPPNFVGAGEPLPHVSSSPAIEWVCGQYKPLGNGLFRICLDRTWSFTANYVGARQIGNETIRPIFEPCGLTLPKNTTGKPQKISFDKINEVKAGTPSITLSAHSDAGLPVSYYVVAGPAIVQDGQLRFTPIPPKSKYPITVTVAAWQWGRNKEPKIKMADIVKQSFLITK